MKFLCIGIEDIGFRAGLLRSCLRNSLCGLLCYCRLVCSRSRAVTRCIIDVNSRLNIINLNAAQNTFAFVFYGFLFLRCSISAFKCSLGAHEHRKKEKAAMSFYDHCCEEWTFPGGIEPSTSA